MVACLAGSLWFVWYCSCQGVSLLVGGGVVVSIIPSSVLVGGRRLPVISRVPLIGRVCMSVCDGVGHAVTIKCRDALVTGLGASV